MIKLTYLPAPFYSSPNTKIDDYPHHKQTDGYVWYNSTPIFYATRNLDDLISYKTRKH
jgi:hypothetical protein